MITNSARNAISQQTKQTVTPNCRICQETFSGATGGGYTGTHKNVPLGPHGDDGIANPVQPFVVLAELYPSQCIVHRGHWARWNMF